MTKHLESLLERYRSEVDGEVTSRARVIDRLLDLRLEAEEAATQAIVDRALAEMPGRTTVPTDWWVEQIELVSASLSFDGD